MIDLTVPEAGESVSEADIAQWSKQDGDWVDKDEIILVLETEKASLDVRAEQSGKLKILKEEGTTVNVGDVIAQIDTNATAPSNAASNDSLTPDVDKQNTQSSSANDTSITQQKETKSHPSPAAKNLMSSHQLEANSIQNPTGKDGRITKQDVLKELTTPSSVTKNSEFEKESTQVKATLHAGDRAENKERMTRLRKTIAKRLVNAQQSSALLTTFNEIDMSAVMELRKKYKEKFKEKYQVNLGMMSFFVKAAVCALQEFPIMNAKVEDDYIVKHNYCDIGIAVATPKGLVVPIIKNAQLLSVKEIEETIINYAIKGRDGTLSPDELTGGTFTITNGGTFGSMFSTPIINHPQSAILGMHNIVKRPVAVDNEVVIRPIMYVAVSYDHRIIDGSDAVRFLYNIKEKIEDPNRLLINI